MCEGGNACVLTCVGLGSDGFVADFAGDEDVAIGGLLAGSAGARQGPDPLQGLGGPGGGHSCGHRCGGLPRRCLPGHTARSAHKERAVHLGGFAGLSNLMHFLHVL